MELLGGYKRISVLLHIAKISVIGWIAVKVGTDSTRLLLA